MNKKYRIFIDCANCASNLEKAIQDITGVAEASLNFLAGTLRVKFTDECNIEETEKAILRVCKHEGAELL